MRIPGRILMHLYVLDISMAKFQGLEPSIDVWIGASSVVGCMIPCVGNSAIPGCLCENGCSSEDPPWLSASSWELLHLMHFKYLHLHRRSSSFVYIYIYIYIRDLGRLRGPDWGTLPQSVGLFHYDSMTIMMRWCWLMRRSETTFEFCVMTRMMFWIVKMSCVLSTHLFHWGLTVNASSSPLFWSIAHLSP